MAESEHEKQEPANPAGDPTPSSKADAEEAADVQRPEESAEAALDAAGAAVDSLRNESEEDAEALKLQEFAAKAQGGPGGGIELLSRVNLSVRVELGRTRMLVEDVLRLNEGAVVELDKLAGDPVDIYVNDRHVARGEVLVLNDNFCVRVSEILAHATTPDEREDAPAQSA